MKLKRLLRRLPSRTRPLRDRDHLHGSRAVLLWWRGPSWSAIGDAFTVVVAVGRSRSAQSARGRRAALVARAELERDRRRVHDGPVGVGGGRGRPQSRVGRRARDRVADGHPPGDAAAASRQPARLLGILGRALRERSPAGPDRRARPRRRARAQAAEAQGPLGDARRHGVRASRLRPRAGRAPDRLRRRDGEDPVLGDHEPRDLRRRRLAALHVCVRERAAAARREGRPHGRRCAAS